MLFSIVTVTYNSEKTLKRTINSLLYQNFSNFEYILIDGSSSDTTIEIIKSYEVAFKKRNINYTWISEKDTGIYDAFNKGIKLAKGLFVMFLHSDDKLYDTKTLQKIHNFTKITMLFTIINNIFKMFVNFSYFTN